MARQDPDPYDPFTLPPGWPYTFLIEPDPGPDTEETATGIATLIGLLTGAGLGIAALNATITYFAAL